MKKTLRPTLLSQLVVGGVVLLVLALSAFRPLPSPSTNSVVPVVIPPDTTATSTVEEGIPAGFGAYIQVLDSCGVNFDGEPCVNMRSGPGTRYPVLKKLRNGMVFKVARTVVTNGRTWYKIGFDGEIHYPERITDDWYVAADYVHLFYDKGVVMSNRGINVFGTKRIIIDLSQRLLFAYDGDKLFMAQQISTGLQVTPTPTGIFWVYRKMPDSYMQGPIAGLSEQYYDLPGVPWDLYFTKDGGAIHGAYWHNHFGQVWSHGCVNLPPDQAKILYEWADLGTPVMVQS